VSEFAEVVDTGEAESHLVDTPVEDNSFHGPDATKQATAELTEERRQRDEVAERRQQKIQEAGLDKVLLDDETKPPREIGYVNKEPDEPVTLRQASKDLAAYRIEQAQLAAENREMVDKIIDAAPEDAAQPVAVPEQANEPTAEEQQRFQQAQQVAQQIAAVEQQSALLLSAVQSIAGQEFADVRSVADLAALQQQNPQRFARFQEFANVAQAAAAKLHQAASYQQQAAMQEFAKFAEAQDAKADEIIPELKNPETRYQFQQRAAKTLTEAGFSEAEIRRGWGGETF
jgi:hypothetical protein